MNAWCVSAVLWAPNLHKDGAKWAPGAPGALFEWTTGTPPTPAVNRCAKKLLKFSSIMQIRQCFSHNNAKMTYCCPGNFSSTTICHSDHLPCVLRRTDFFEQLGGPAFCLFMLTIFYSPHSPTISSAFSPSFPLPSVAVALLCLKVIYLPKLFLAIAGLK